MSHEHINSTLSNSPFEDTLIVTMGSKEEHKKQLHKVNS